MRLVKSRAIRHDRIFDPNSGYTYNDYLALKFDIKLSKTERKSFLSKLRRALRADRQENPFSETTPNREDKVWNDLKDKIDDFLSERAWGQKYLLRGMTSTIQLEAGLIVYELVNYADDDDTVVLYVLDEKRKEDWYPDSLR